MGERRHAETSLLDTDAGEGPSSLGGLDGERFLSLYWQVLVVFRTTQAAHGGPCSSHWACS